MSNLGVFSLPGAVEIAQQLVENELSKRIFRVRAFISSGLF